VGKSVGAMNSRRPRQRTITTPSYEERGMPPCWVQVQCLRVCVGGGAAVTTAQRRYNWYSHVVAATCNTLHDSIHTHTHARTHTHTHTHTRTNTHTHTPCGDTHTHTHRYTHTDTLTRGSDSMGGSRRAMAVNCWMSL
jgi:hypothetical protein